MKEKLTIKLKEYSWTCGDGCCSEFGTITEVNGVVLPNETQDDEVILEQILKHLGYEVEIINEYNYE